MTIVTSTKFFVYFFKLVYGIVRHFV